MLKGLAIRTSLLSSSNVTARVTATTVSAAGGKSQAFIDLSIAVKNIHMPRVKNTIPSPFFVVSLFVARLRWRHGSRGGAIITTRE